MPDATEKSLSEQKNGSLALLLDFEQNMETLKLQLQEPISGVTAIALAKKFCDESTVKYVSTRVFGESCKDNSRMLVNCLTLMTKDTPFNNVAVDLDTTLKQLSVHIQKHLTQAITLVNEQQDDDKALALRKDVYRLKHLASFYYRDDLADTYPNSVDEYGYGEDQGDYLLDDDLLGTAKAALDEFVSCSGLANTCLERLSHFADRYRLVLRFLEMFHSRFLGYTQYAV